MSLIGGFYSFEKKGGDSRQVCSRLKEFSFLENERKDDDEIAVYDYDYGYLFAKKKIGCRSLVSCSTDTRGNIRLILGFLTHANWEDWDFEKGAARQDQLYPDDYADRLVKSEGEFTAIFLHAASGTLHIVNDRFAARPLYFRVTREGLYFCSNLFFLTRMSDSPVEFDPVGLMQLYRHSNTIGPFTHLKGCERLQPATHLMIQGTAVRKSTYWTLTYEPDFGLDPEAHAEAAFSELCRSVKLRVRLSQRTLLPLSGGLDSRSIAACLTEGMRVPSCTLVSEKQFSQDQEAAAAMVAEALLLRHSEVKIEPTVSLRAQEIIRLTGGLIFPQYSAKSIQAPYGEYDIFLDGGPGDVLIGSYIRNMYCTLPRNSREILVSYYASDSVNSFQCLFNSNFLQAVRKPFVNAGEELIDQLKYATAAEGLGLWKMIYRQPAFTFAQIAHSHPYGTSVYPHLGYGYLDLILKLPPLWLFEKQFYKYMIYRCAPQLRHIPYANTGELLSGKIGKTTAPLIAYKRYAARRRLTAFYRKYFPPPQRAVEAGLDCYHLRQDKKLLKEMREMLDGYPALSEIFNTDFCIDYLNRFETGVDIPRVSANPDHPVGFMASVLYTYQYLIKTI